LDSGPVEVMRCVIYIFLDLQYSRTSRYFHNFRALLQKTIFPNFYSHNCYIESTSQFQTLQIHKEVTNYMSIIFLGIEQKVKLHFF